MGFLNAPVKPVIDIAASGYGMMMGPGASHPKARAWLVVQPDGTGILRVAHNDPSTGRPTYTDAGVVASAEVSSRSWKVTLTDGSVWSLVIASCVCGAGAVGYAGPSDSPHNVQIVRTDTLGWISIV